MNYRDNSYVYSGNTYNDSLGDRPASARRPPKLSEGRYEPIVSIIMKKNNARPDNPVGRGRVEITVKNNGKGIPQKVMDKKFQPFLTPSLRDKPRVWELSLSYDTIKTWCPFYQVKKSPALVSAHRWKSKVGINENEGAKFIILLS